MKNITGQRFGKLTVIRPVEERKRGAVVWECLCDCGATCFVTGYRLRSGETRSCGCIRYTDSALRGKPYAEDLTGQKYGRLTVVRATEARKRGSVVWECRCDCGKTVMAPRFRLTGGHYHSCGCERREKVRELVPELAEKRERADGTVIDILKKKKKRKNNTSGHTGVIYRSDAQKYAAIIGFQGKNYYLGLYSDIADAVEVRKKAEALIHNEAIEFYEKWKVRADADPEWAKENPVRFTVKRDLEGVYAVSCSPAL